MINIIAAITMNGIIGIENALPFDYPEDLKHFKKTTLDSVIIMGRKTFEGIGKPLPRRENVVITSKDLKISEIKCYPSLSKAISEQSIIFRDKHTDIWLIGGFSIYQEGMIYADEIHLTITPDIELRSNSVKFPWINPLLFELSELKPLIPEDNNCKLQYAIYRKI